MMHRTEMNSAETYFNPLATNVIGLGIFNILIIRQEIITNYREPALKQLWQCIVQLQNGDKLIIFFQLCMLITSIRIRVGYFFTFIVYALIELLHRRIMRIYSYFMQGNTPDIPCRILLMAIVFYNVPLEDTWPVWLSVFVDSYIRGMNIQFQPFPFLPQREHYLQETGIVSSVPGRARSQQETGLVSSVPGRARSQQETGLVPPVSQRKHFPQKPVNLMDVTEEELTCPICYLLMQESIFMCANGHNICIKCKRRIYECPICRNRCLESRNIALEKIAKSIQSNSGNRRRKKHYARKY